MTDEKRTAVDVGNGGPRVTRTKDNPIGIDDIGLPAGIQKDEVSAMEQIRPDPE